MSRILPCLAIAILTMGLPAMAAMAQPGGLAARDSGAPIQITADELTVRQQDNLAIFQGDVDAVQGEMSLKADVLRVFYAGGGNETAPAAAGQDIQRIEAEGNVLLSQPTQSAAGDRGTYDVAGGTMTLTGNVVLTSEGNVVRGGHLDLDLATGVATLTPATGGKGGQRVRAVFQSQPKQEP